MGFNARTKIITKEGLFTLQQCIDRNIHGWNGKAWSKLKVEGSSKMGKMYRLSFSNGSFIEVTLHQTITCSSKANKWKDIEAGDILKDMDTNWFRVQRSVITDFNFGKPGTDQSYFYGESFDANKWLLSGRSILEQDKESILSYVAGMFDCHGTTSSKGIRMYGNLDTLLELQLLLMKVGYSSSVCEFKKRLIKGGIKDMWYINISKTLGIPCKRLVCNNAEDYVAKGKNVYITHVDLLKGVYPVCEVLNENINIGTILLNN